MMLDVIRLLEERSTGRAVNDGLPNGESGGSVDVVRPFVPIVGGLGFLIIGLKMASTGSTELMHSYHLLGVLPQDRERLGRTVGLCLAVTGAGALLAGIPSLIGHGEACFGIAATGAAVSLAGCGAGVVALFYFQLIRPRGFKK